MSTKIKTTSFKNHHGEKVFVVRFASGLRGQDYSRSELIKWAERMIARGEKQ